MGAPGQVNSRNYLQDNYYLVISPVGSNIHMDAVRHTYLHFVLDPLVAKRATALQLLKPVLMAVQKAPMAEEYKFDAGLLVIECLIRAIEARTPADPKLPEKDRLAMVQQDEAEGFVLTGYFYDQLQDFRERERWPASGFSRLAAQPGRRPRKEAGQRNRVMRRRLTPEVMRAAKPASQSKVDLAERELASGNPAGAQKLAEEALAGAGRPGPCLLRAGPGCHSERQHGRQHRKTSRKRWTAPTIPRYRPGATFILAAFSICRTTVRLPWPSTRRRSTSSTYRPIRRRPPSAGSKNLISLRRAKH